MKLSDEDDSKVFCSDLPDTEEYSRIIFDAQDAGKAAATNSNYDKIEESNQKAWSGITNLMAKCIARGMRLQRERGGVKWA